MKKNKCEKNDKNIIFIYYIKMFAGQEFIIKLLYIIHIKA